MDNPDVALKKNLEKGAWTGSRDPVNFWALNGNSSKMAKDNMNFKFGTHAPRKSLDMTPEKNYPKGSMASVT